MKPGRFNRFLLEVYWAGRSDNNETTRRGMAVLERMLMSGNYHELSLDSFVKILSVEDMSISMTARYQKIVVAYYGLDHRNKCSSTAELALQYDVSKSRINYLRHAALKKLATLVIFKNLHLLVQVKMMVDALAGEKEVTTPSYHELMEQRE